MALTTTTTLRREKCGDYNLISPFGSVGFVFSLWFRRCTQRHPSEPLVIVCVGDLALCAPNSNATRRPSCLFSHTQRSKHNYL